MKKWVTGSIILLILLLPLPVYAADYSIEETNITASLQADGKVMVEESHTYAFDGEFNGITRTLIPKQQGTEITDVRAEENGKALEVEREGDLYKVYRGGSDETITVDLFYTIENGMEHYADVSQFYWPFFDDRNESTYEDLTITVVPPAQTEAKVAFGYDAAYETEQLLDDGSVRYEMGEVPANEKGDIRVAYDASLFYAAGNTKEMLGTILAEKKSLDDEAAEKKQREEQWGKIGAILTVSATALAVLLYGYGLRRRKMTGWDAERIKGGSLFPDHSMSIPGMISFMKGGYMNHKALTAAMLDLVRKGLIEEQSKKVYKRLDRHPDHEHEQQLIEWLYDDIAQSDTLYIDDIERYAKNKENSETYRKRHHSWQKLVRKEVKEQSLYASSAVPRWTAGLTALGLFPFTILLPLNGTFLWMIFVILLLIYFLLFSIAYKPLNVEGRSLYDQLQPLKKDDDWETWEEEDRLKALLFQIGAGKRDPLSQPFPSSTQSSEIATYVVIGSYFETNFSDAQRHTTVSASSGSSSSGGGTGGGGGGSGAF